MRGELLNLKDAGKRLCGKVTDTIREAALMATGRRLHAEALAEASQAGLQRMFGAKVDT